MKESHFEPTPGGRRLPWVAWPILGLVMVAGYFLLGGHRQHAVALVPYLLLLACPLMHLFHRHGHGGHRSERTPAERRWRHPDEVQEPARKGF